MVDFAAAADSIIALGRRLEQRGLAPATAGNYSVRLADGTLAITVSGTHKGRLLPDQVMRVSGEGVALDGKNPSAEMVLHCLVYAVRPDAGAVLHTHSVAGTVLSRALAGETSIVFRDYEVLKAFPDIATHETAVELPLVENSQDMPALAERLQRILAASPLLAFYIRGHGLYAWGPTIEAAENLVEASEFLLACAWEEWKAANR